ncbi:DNA-binding protein, partial [Propionibacterium freudenreichii]|nr:DNA-binding protein [Propionibacterium freudenreichii]
MSASSRSLADAIRAFDAQQLAVLLRARPDLTQPRPLDLSELIERLSARASTLRALDRLDAWHLLVAQAVAAWEGGGDPVDDKQLAAAMGLPDDVAAVDRALDGLRQLGLAWGSPVHLTQAARAAFGEHPGGLAAV